MRNKVKISMQNGDFHIAAGNAKEIVKELATAKLTDRLASIETDNIPTGQVMYLDPTQVSSVRDDKGWIKMQFGIGDRYE